MSEKKKQAKPIISPQRLKREAEALRANLARRKQQQRGRQDDEPGNEPNNEPGDATDIAGADETMENGDNDAK
ncbi:hypothetical protein [Thalassospira mesophila]|uniref:Uncharacterized protein n=1 Tax=Thalassospira mesophila TaxID=1293891 RepID=A0A1Y2L0M1_9PROT|nr:hypothetical protein [Thalassospira mesophila]OSQ38364.1 hypothetical protein TMES_10885 [Thalassospira mesophila]